MMMPSPWSTSPGRVGSAVQSLPSAEALASGDLVLLGQCNEAGILANGGRPGAALGPGAFREAFGRLPASVLRGRRCFDAGDVPADAPYEEHLKAARSLVSAAIRRGALPVVVGGGHDGSYGCYLGLTDLEDLSPLRPPAVLSVDAHLDVRPDHGPNSGNPFFRMLEHGLPGEDLAAVGLVPYVNDPAHAQWLRERGAALHWKAPFQEAQLVTDAKAALTRFQGRGRRVLATFDLDAFAFPGVSAPNPFGLGPDAGLALAQAFGACPAVAVLDLMELSPPHDPTGATARFAALLLAAFLEARG